MDKLQFSDSWGIILGGSSGFGLATLHKLSAAGMNIVVLYREFAATDKKLREAWTSLEHAHGVKIIPLNVNALTGEGQEHFRQEMRKVLPGKKCVRLLLHSIARGNLKFLESLTAEDISLTIRAMGTSLLDWAKLLIEEDLFREDARVIGLTSEGTRKHWEGYGAISVAKAAMESLAGYMSVELAGRGIRTNLIQAGITDSPSLKKIPGSAELLEHARQRNPLGRITRPEDIASVIYLLCTDEAAWINGALIHVDGGEHRR